MIYHGLQSRVYHMLQEIPWTRERSRKDEAIVKLLTNKKTWDGHLSAFTLPELTDLVKDHNSADRAWRLIIDAHKELRGSDYEDKKILEQKKQLDLGYTPGYHQDVKQLALIAN